MRIVILYRPNSENARAVEEFVHNYQQIHPVNHLEVANPDDQKGAPIASLYDVNEYPSILVLQDDGQLYKSWSGSTLPLADELSAYDTM